jgi:cysteinyl-tRNA synthetase
LLASVELVRQFIDEIEPIVRGSVAPTLVAELREEKIEKFAPRISEFETKINELIELRNAARAVRNFKESDRIRDELAKMGVVLKDSKDGTTWEIAR